MPALITLTTDMGLRDPYVAAMKGVISRACPSAMVIDLTHDIGPQNVLEGALFLAGATHYFPPGTIHCAVVDPGVGTDRLAIAASAGGQVFVCPDNGLLSIHLESHSLDEARVITNPRCTRDTVSATFHGRDIFAPTAAALAGGLPLADVGHQLESVVRLEIRQPLVESADRITGEIIHIDRFGNCITNIRHDLIETDATWTVRAGGHCITGLVRTYADAPPDTPLALIGSADHLEIAINQGNAEDELDLHRGDPVELLR